MVNGLVWTRLAFSSPEVRHVVCHQALSGCCIGVCILLDRRRLLDRAMIEELTSRTIVFPTTISFNTKLDLNPAAHSPFATTGISSSFRLETIAHNRGACLLSSLTRFHLYDSDPQQRIRDISTLFPVSTCARWNSAFIKAAQYEVQFGLYSIYHKIRRLLQLLAELRYG
jgi:hypothetical protein